MESERSERGGAAPMLTWRAAPRGRDVWREAIAPWSARVSGAPVVQRYVAANEAELRAQLNLVQTATDKRLKALIKALRVSLPVAARADLQVRLTHAGANLVQIRATLVDVAHQHPVVYRPASVGFLKPEALDGAVIQAVEMADAQGTLWVAVYKLQRQRGGAWRCSL